MKRLISLVFLALLLSALLFLFTSCGNSQIVNIDGVDTVVEPYGWANHDTKKVEGVLYEVSVGNVILSIVFSETVIIPVWLTGWQIYEPVKNQ